jgi:hypothetical protein
MSMLISMRPEAPAPRGIVHEIAHIYCSTCGWQRSVDTMLEAQAAAETHVVLHRRHAAARPR